MKARNNEQPEKFCKITEEMYENTDTNIQDYLVSKINTFVDGPVMDLKDGILFSLIDCESPIEQLFAIGLYIYNVENLSLYNQHIESVNINKQCEILVDGKRYRPDFLIQVVYKGKKRKYCINFIVECDGYNFHQKTKDQVSYDNVRTRDLQKTGYEIVRFSGTEIWNKLYKCIKELIDIILSKCE